MDKWDSMTQLLAMTTLLAIASPVVMPLLLNYPREEICASLPGCAGLEREARYGVSPDQRFQERWVLRGDLSRLAPEPGGLARLRARIEQQAADHRRLWRTLGGVAPPVVSQVIDTRPAPAVTPAKRRRTPHKRGH